MQKIKQGIVETIILKFKLKIPTNKNKSTIGVKAITPKKFNLELNLSKTAENKIKI